MQNLIKIHRVVQGLWVFSLKRPRPTKMMLGKASSPFCIPVAIQCKNKTKFTMSFKNYEHFTN